LSFSTRVENIDKGLIIFDNSDEFEKNNKVQLEMNLKYLEKQFENLTFIFLSDCKLNQKYGFKSFEIKPYATDVESCLHI
jgi:hypothetical protein